MVTLFARKFRGAVRPDVGSVRPVGYAEIVAELQGTIVAVAEVVVLQYGEPEGPPSP
jgi:hypothetical protein